LIQAKHTFLTMRATGFFKSASGCSQFVCIKHGESMHFKSRLMDFLCTKAKLFKTISS